MRRLVQLELADVDVPPRSGDAEVALFVRVLAAGEGQLRVELWERGEQYGARSVPDARGASSLTARRVALAAAELARGLRQRRRAEKAAAERSERRAAELARIAAEKTLDGPRALRSGVSASLARDLVLVGPTLELQLHVWGATRVDLGTGWSAGWFEGQSGVEAWTLRAGPMHRFVLGSRLDLDIGAHLDASVLSFLRSRAVDGAPGQEQSWSSRVEVALRLEPRVTRGLRLSFGITAGAALRLPEVEPLAGAALSAGRLYVGPDFGVVFTPDAGR